MMFKITLKTTIVAGFCNVEGTRDDAERKATRGLRKMLADGHFYENPPVIEVVEITEQEGE